MNISTVHLDYGSTNIPFVLDKRIAKWHIIEPKSEIPLENLHPKFIQACRNPINSLPMREIIGRNEKLLIVTSDGTRPVPNRNLIKWILEELNVSPDNVTILLGNGTHRKNTSEEIKRMFGNEIYNSVKIVNHDAYDAKQNVLLGCLSNGSKVFVDKFYTEFSKRIVVGYIEPHLFAGFSGGSKAVFPGIAGIETILNLHRSELIAHPMSKWGEIKGNPVQQEIIEMISLLPPDFLINVSLNVKKEITGFFCGNYFDAHIAGCDRVQKMSMVRIPKKYPVVITSNSGFPLDQNLYQTVKGISAAARVVETGGTIFVISECRDGIPANGNFAKLMQYGRTPDDVLRKIVGSNITILDQWQAQILSTILKYSDVAVYSMIDKEEIVSCKLKFVQDLYAAVHEKICKFGKSSDVAIMPHGPLTIPS